MDKQTFTNLDPEPAWWLTQRDLTPTALTDVRTQIENDLGLGFEWFLIKEKLEQLYDVLEANDNTLLRELDEVIEATDETTRLAWISKVAGVVSPPAQQPAAAAAVTEAAPVETAQAETATAATTTQPEEPQQQQPVAAHEEVAPAAVAAEAPAVTWDAGWGMFLRYSDGNYQYSLSRILSDSPGTEAPAGEPDGTWYDNREAATAARTEVAELKASVSELLTDNEDTITPEALQEALTTPGFKDMVEDANKELEDALAQLDDE